HRALGKFQPRAFGLGNLEIVGDDIELLASHPKRRVVVDFHAAIYFNPSPISRTNKNSSRRVPRRSATDNSAHPRIGEKSDAAAPEVVGKRAVHDKTNFSSIVSKGGTICHDLTFSGAYSPFTWDAKWGRSRLTGKE